MSNTKRSNNKRAFSSKKDVIEEFEKNCNKSVLAKQFNLPRSTIQDVLRNKPAILKAIEDGSSAKRARLTKRMHADMEEALVQWIKQVRSQNIAISGEIVKVKAKEIAAILKIVGFEASQGWMDNFKNRHGILFKSNQGETGAINEGLLRDWQQQSLRSELVKFSADDIFNVDETGLFWQLLPNKTLAFKGEKCTNGKNSKQRIKVLVGSNMSGSEKLPLLVIGKSKNPRCFKGATVPLDYIANAKEWTGAAFEEWLRKWDKNLKKSR